MEVQLRRLGPSAGKKTLRVPKECRTKIWLAGRGTGCQIYTKSKYASRQHFSITYRQQSFFISDLQSANGTFLNNEKLACEKALTFGSIISVGVPSEMQNSPDCIVYIFESISDALPNITKNDENCTALETKNSSENLRTDGQAVPILQCPTSDPQPIPNTKEFYNESLNVEIRNDDNEKTTLNESFSSDVILIESPSESKLLSESIQGPTPAKIRKLNDCNINEKNEKHKERAKDMDEDILAYEALTQADEPQVKSEPELLNYSQTEELIEISDSEEESLKLEGNKSPEVLDENNDDDDDDDDDIVILETIIRDHSRTGLPPANGINDEDMTELDKKWMGRLLKIKKEEVFKGGQEENMECEKEKEPSKTIDMVIDDTEEVEQRPETFIHTSEMDKFSIIPCTISLERLSTNDSTNEHSEAESEFFHRVEIPKKIVKSKLCDSKSDSFSLDINLKNCATGVECKKSVSFDMIPRIKYFEVPTRTKLTPSEKGRLRFNRIIFNICNWNTHWLEECKKVAPEKVPNDICEERLRKIPKKFPNHSDYMVAFIPAMLLQLWNKIKDKWVASGESGFRQTVSCDFCEDYHTENLSVYQCTGLVQSVNAHKQLLREGHLVLLRLHQIQVPQFTTPAAEKYSKKLGYLVFGFVESKVYERYHNQPLHRSLAERCSSIVGDLHVVRLAILVKKRPSFQIDKQKLIQITVVQQISQEMRMFRGICLLPDSRLCNVILKPTKQEGPLPDPPKKNIVFKGPIDEAQSDIVSKLSFACSSESSLLYSIHGAAGTGKGQVIIALILQLLFGAEWKSKRPKIIYCTQWSIPLDETVSKLKTLRQTLRESFNLVRIGPVREVKPEVRDLCVSTLASNAQNTDRRDSRNFDAEIEIIKEADVLCTTCTSSGTAKICSAFEKILIKDRDRKVICIMDEAMSCKETESVIPLLLGVTHLILVGDIYQMEPIFSGERTHSLGLDMSLFWRVYRNYINIPKELWPISVLKTQYRMNSSLSRFTSQFLYSTVLQKPSESISNRMTNIRTHLFLVDKTPENIAKEEQESRDVRIVSQLAKAVINVMKSVVTHSGRFGIIMRDTKQVESLQYLLPKRDFPEVEIGQIQSFQGREVEVLIFVYDGRKILTSWLATGLTRARRSLFLYASEQAINGNPLLHKIATCAGNHNFLRYVHPDMTLPEFEQVFV